MMAMTPNIDIDVMRKHYEKKKKSIVNGSKGKIDHHKRKTIIIHNLDTRKKRAIGYNLWSDWREDGKKNATHSSS